MKRFFACTISIMLILFSFPAQVFATDFSLKKQQQYTIADLISLQKFLLSVPDSNTSETVSYDLDSNKICNVFDFVIMQQKLLYTTQKTNILIAYFSKTGTTESIANALSDKTGGDLFQIEPTEAYPENYNDCLTQAQKELNENIRPSLSSHIENIDDYDIIFIGYPIWYGYAPRVVCTFLEEYDLNDKMVIPFCTSGSSSISASQREIQELCPQSNVRQGLGISSSNLSRAESLIDVWLAELENVPQVKLSFEGKEVMVTLYNNDVAKQLVEQLPLTLECSDYNSTEKILYLPQNLDVSSMPDGFDPSKGDLTLYAPWGNLAIFYQDFRYSNQLISIGHIYDDLELLSQMQGNFTITLEAA